MRPSLAICYAFATLSLLMAGCTKEKPNCGHGHTTFSLRFKIVDDRTGADWFGQLSPNGLDSLKQLNLPHGPQKVGSQITWGLALDDGEYYLPATGGDLTQTLLLHLSPTDTDTVEAKVPFGPLANDPCDTYHNLETMELRYNGRLNGRYDRTSGWNGANFVCSGCGSIEVVRKRRP